VSDTSELPNDIDALRALVLAQRAELELARSGLIEQRYEIDALKARLAKLLRATFGRSSEKLRSEIEQLELVLADLDEQLAEIGPAIEPATNDTPDDQPSGAGRSPLSPALPRQTVEAASHVGHTGGEPDPHASSWRDHPRSAVSTRRSAVRLTPSSTRTRQPSASSISIRRPGWCAASSGTRGSASDCTAVTGRNNGPCLDASLPIRTCRRQVNSRPGYTSCRAAI